MVCGKRIIAQTIIIMGRFHTIVRKYNFEFSLVQQRFWKKGSSITILGFRCFLATSNNGNYFKNILNYTNNIMFLVRSVFQVWLCEEIEWGVAEQYFLSRRRFTHNWLQSPVWSLVDTGHWSWLNDWPLPTGLSTIYISGSAAFAEYLKIYPEIISNPNRISRTSPLYFLKAFFITFPHLSIYPSRDIPLGYKVIEN